MQIFPTQYSTLSSKALGQFIAQQYGFTILTCKLLVHGVSDTYILQGDEAKYILKIYRAAHRSLDEIIGEVELLDILKERGCKVAYPIPDLQGRKVQEFNAIESVRHGVLYSFAPGKASNQLTEEQFRIVGREMATIHNVASTIELQSHRKQYDIASTIERPLKVLEECFAGYKKDAEYAWLVEASGKIAKHIGSLDTSTFSYGYCHYDYFTKNFFFDEDNNITVFDFDFMGKGFLANDLASIFVYFFIRNNLKISEKDIFTDFDIVVAGYKEVRHISDEELKAVPALGFALLLFYLGFQYENVEDWSNYFWGPNYLSERIGVMKQYYELYCISYPVN
jgi:Ser/Thr protein kinase RdoA (MazF antagonist)